MAGKSPTELLEMIAALRLEVGVLTAKVEKDREKVEQADLAAVRERLAVIQAQLADLLRRVEEHERWSARLAVLEAQQIESQKRHEETDRRRWQLVVLLLGSVATLAVQVALLFVKK